MTVAWKCPKCGTENIEEPETVIAECSECGEAHDMPEPAQEMPDAADCVKGLGDAQP